MKIAFFSDTHGRHGKLDKWFSENCVDILVFAGDYQYNSLDGGVDFANWFLGIDCKHKVLVPGNHDTNFQMIRQILLDNGVHVLINSGEKINGLDFWGSPYTIRYGDWAYMCSESGMRSIFSQTPPDTEILVTHSPAYDLGLDYTRREENAGSRSITSTLKKLKKLKVHACGHIHEGRGIIDTGKAVYVNCSVLDVNYRKPSPPITIIL